MPGLDSPTSGTQGTRSVGTPRKRNSRKKKVEEERKLEIFEPNLEDGSYAGVTMVTTVEELGKAMAHINHYMKPRVKQLTREIFVSFGGFNISRKGFLGAIAVTDGFGITFIFDVISLGDDLWADTTDPTQPGMRDFLEVAYNEKVVFDVREVKDCLKYVYNVELKGMFDLRIVELMNRGKIKTHAVLPHEKIKVNGIEKDTIAKTFLFTRADIEIYYIKQDLRSSISHLGDEIGEKTWRVRKNGVDDSIIRYLVEHQKFIIYLWRNYTFGDIDKDKLYWISSERFNNLYMEKEKRTYDKFEINDITPKYVVCQMTTDQPLGGVRCEKCLRMLPSQEFTDTMKMTRQNCVCSICVQIESNSLKTPKVGSAIKTKKKKKKKKGKKKVRIEGEEDESNSSSSEEEVEES